MAIYRTGTFTRTDVSGSPVAINLNLGFVPSYFWCEDLTAASSSGSGAEAFWDINQQSLATPITTISVYSGGTDTRSTITTLGIVPFTSTDASLFVPQQAPYTTTGGNRVYIGQSTNLVITGISQAAQASITATHSFTASDIGVTVVTFHGVPGMLQINGLSGVIQSVTGTTSFTVNINTTNFAAYSSAGKTAGLNTGFANVITGAPVTTLYSNTVLPTAEANLGFTGLTIGTGVIAAVGGGTANGDVWSYHAWLQSPVTGP